MNPVAAPTFSSAPVGGSAPANGSAFAQGLDAVQQLQTNADTAATQLATGQLTDVSVFTTAAAKAQLGVELTVALRDKAVEAYQDIMRMQV